MYHNINGEYISTVSLITLIIEQMIDEGISGQDLLNSLMEKIRIGVTLQKEDIELNCSFRELAKHCSRKVAD